MNGSSGQPGIKLLFNKAGPKCGLFNAFDSVKSIWLSN